MKKLLLIGNKPLCGDFENVIKDYDMIVRVNRMMNYHECTGKTDLWLADIHSSAEKLFNIEEKEKFLKAKKSLIFNHSLDAATHFLDSIGYDGERMSIGFDDLDIKKYIPSYKHEYGLRVTNSIWMLIYCLEHFSHDYEIHTLGIGNRYFLNCRLHLCHQKIYKAEEFFIESLITSGKITSLDFDLDIEPYDGKTDNYLYTGKFPSFSSFWHNEDSNELPKLAIASIKSFLQTGAKYYLYTYKDFTNIPEGCIVKDANEIIPFSEFYTISRKGVKEYASFSDYFRAMLVNKVDTCWTDTDNFFIRDDFETDNVLIVQEGRIQPGFFYLGNNEKGIKFKKMLYEFYENPTLIRDYDNAEMIEAKKNIQKYETKKEALSHARWSIGASCLWTSINETIKMGDDMYDYYKYFNNFKFTEQYQLWEYEDYEYMHFSNRHVKILTMSMNLLDREPEIVAKFNHNSYMAKIIDKYT